MSKCKHEWSKGKMFYGKSDCPCYEIDRLKAELESKDKAIKLLQGHCNALMDTEGKLAQWKKGHTAWQEAAGYYQKQADDMIRQLRKELSDENANFAEEIMNLERQLAEANAEVERLSALTGEWCKTAEMYRRFETEARKQTAREICDYLQRSSTDDEISKGYVIDHIKRRFGLEG